MSSLQLKLTFSYIVARRAEAILAAENPAVLSSALTMLSYLEKSHPTLVEEGSHPFTECATFADDVKGSYSWESSWHFIDTPYLDKGDSISNYPKFSEGAYDIVGALTNLTDWLSGNGTAYKTSYYYKQITASFPNSNDAESFALRFIIHFVGDIHQPLHTVAEVDSTYPSGDAGGNSEKVPSTSGVTNLHGVWDSVIYEYTGYPVLVSNFKIYRSTFISRRVRFTILNW